MADFFSAQRRRGLAVFAALLFAQPELGRADMVDKSGMAAWEICALCHSADGISVMPKFPKLAGQKAAYIERQFLHFRGGERANDGGQMQTITTEVEAQDMPGIFNYFASLPAPPAYDLDQKQLQQNPDFAEQLEQGKTLFYKGDKNIPACATCHAEKESPAPWIDAQHRSYIEKQLADFHSGQRSDSNMTKIAAGLSEKDIAAVALFLETIRLPRE